jgi:phosphopantothenoylcysteine decarboxylase/phosphopantothenate--cysteine ligase
VSAALDGKFVVLGVTGSIAAYKSIELARRLMQAGATVQVVMSRSATELVRPLTFQALTYRPVEVEMFQIQDERAAGHVAMGRQAHVVVIAPATAHLIARLAAGFSDDLIATTVLATAAPIVVCPAMETHMWQNAATQANVATLRARGMRIVEPETGPLASGDVGPGRLAALERIEAAIAEALVAGEIHSAGAVPAGVSARGALAGRKVVVTAGPTVEAIDPVRFVSNRSSGKMGYAIAKAAYDAGADVTLVSGPTALVASAGVRMIVIESAQDMKESVLALLPETDVVIMAAAVADYRPTETSTRKIKRRDAGSELTIRLTENPDVLKAVVAGRKRGTIVVGFKAETGDATKEAERMLREKKLDLVVGNDISEPGSVFGSDTDKVTFVSADGVEALPLLPKTEVAQRLVAKLAARLAKHQSR